MPNTIKSIGDSFKGTFSGTALTEICLPNQIKTIPYNCFKNCKKLRKIQLPDFLEEIKPSAFEGDESLVHIHLPSKVKTVGRYAFWDCINLTKVELNEGLEKIGDAAFKNTSMLEEITMPSTVVDFGEDIFKCATWQRRNAEFVMICYPGSKAMIYARMNAIRIEEATYHGIV